MEIKFTKAVGAGNDFIIVQGDSTPHDQNWIPLLCDRKEGVGADGVILIEPSQKADLRMRTLNADGSEAEMCGNGVRCVAEWSYKNKLTQDHMTIETIAGILSAELTSNGPKVQMTKPKDKKLKQEVQVKGQDWTFHQINTGVPHIVLFSDGIENINVLELGCDFRNHPLFQPSGTNVNFVQIMNEDTIKVRTYERGVEGETLACGTGATASALMAHEVHGLKSPIKVVTFGGETLQIDFDDKVEGEWAHVFMCGPVKIIFEGKINI